MANKLDVLRVLPSLRWRGVSYPVASRSVSFAHESVQHVITKGSQNLIEQVNPHNLVFSYTIPMRDGIFKGPYKSLFSAGLSKLFADLRNKEPGTLQDPIYGIFRCVPTSFADDTDTNKRDGTDIRVDFTVAPQEGVLAVIKPTSIRAVASGYLSRALNPIKVTVDDSKPKAVAAQRSMASLNDLMTGLSDAVVLTGSQLSNYRNDIHTASDRAKSLESKANSLVLAEARFVKRDARRARAHMIDLRSRSDIVARAANVTITRARSVVSIANEYGVTVAALVAANKSLLRSPMIPAGSVVFIPQKKT